MEMIAERLRQARLAAGLTQDEVVERLGRTITKAALSNYETGKRTPNAPLLQALGKALGVSSQWFLREQKMNVVWHSYRALTSVGPRRREAIQVMALRQTEAYLEALCLFPAETKAQIPERRVIHQPAEADQLAASLRQRWSLGLDALESVTQCLENHGALIVGVKGQMAKGFDGLSATVNGGRPLVIVNMEGPVDRLRFNLLHELGHALMDTAGVGDPKQEERLAHRFASSFLVPPQVARRELGERRRALTLSELLLLKAKYGLSVAAWAMAARLHGIIDKPLHEALCREMGARGWRKKEPDVFRGAEQPTLLRQMLLRAVAEGLMSVRKAMEIMPDIREQLESEGFLEASRAQEFALLSPETRRGRMWDAAARVAEDYAPGGAMEEALEYDGNGLYEYE